MFRSLCLLVTAASLAAAACGDAAPPPTSAPPAALAQVVPGVPYALTAPSAVVELSDELRELSGLTVLDDGTLGAVQDEAGTLYRLDPATGAVVARESFRSRGDFEGVEQTPGAVWALESNGDLYRLAGGEARKIETDLASRNDTEGLGYDAANDRLLIACKDNPGRGLGDVRAIYAFDLATETLSAAPVFTLDRTRLDGDDPFKPSAIAVHPTTGEIYVLSSVRKALAVLAPDGTIRAALQLPADLYAQPEGIAFLPDGTLFISNEGPAGPATLLRFDQIR